MKRAIGKGRLESLNGTLLFGLTAALLFTMIQGIWPLKNSEGMESYQGPRIRNSEFMGATYSSDPSSGDEEALFGGVLQPAGCLSLMRRGASLARLRSRTSRKRGPQ